MPLDPGVRLGPYEIVAPIGAGGMGEVYRARDTRLDRTVAIKVLPSSLAGDPQLRERFDREARAVSSLNHPHVCTLYDVGHQDPSTGSGQVVDYLVLEYLEGETLDARLRNRDASAADGTRASSRARALTIDEAVIIAIQVADALDRAHRAGIVHRDLKPANIFLVRTGSASAPPVAKLLDFGLAKTAAPAIATSGLSMAPTTPPNLTAQGTILGTFQYMAPEQIEGLEADARSDIFAFGAVLFEMLTGRPAFEGKTRAQLLGAILKDDPPAVSTIAGARSPALDRVVSTCLAKDPDDRWQTARDLLRELKWCAEGLHDAGSSATATAGSTVARRTSRLAWISAGVLAIAFIGASIPGLRHLRETPPAQEPVQFTIPAPDNSQFGGPPGGGTGSATQLAVSPDGRHIAVVARLQNRFMLWVRPTGSVTTRLFPGTEDASFPFWSPDSRFIGFFAAGKLKKVQLAGGPPIVLCDAASGRGGTWNVDNVILFSPDTTTGLQRVSGAGGVPVAASVLDAAYGETSHRWPYFLPDGQHFLYTGVTGTCCPASKPGRVKIGALGSNETAVLFPADSASAYATGHLLFNRDGTLMAQPFDAARRVLAGDPFPVVESLDREGSRYASFTVSTTGVLAYARGTPEGLNHLTWFDRAGRTLGELGEPAAYRGFVLSPDERHVAVAIENGSPPNLDIWTIDVARGVTSRLTFGPWVDNFPVWSHDSARVAFMSTRKSDPGIHQKAAAGTRDEEVLLTDKPPAVPVPTAWSSDGKFIAYESLAAAATSRDIWILPVSGDPKPFPFVQRPTPDIQAAFSPDVHWIAYVSDETGMSQVYVQPFPATGGQYQVSKNGGAQPLWRGDGKELFFLGLDGTMMATPIDTAAGFQPGLPESLFQSRGAALSARQQYAVTKDGKRFLLLLQGSANQTASQPLTVVTNWLASVQR